MLPQHRGNHWFQHFPAQFWTTVWHLQIILDHQHHLVWFCLEWTCYFDAVWPRSRRIFQGNICAGNVLKSMLSSSLAAEFRWLWTTRINLSEKNGPEKPDFGGRQAFLLKLEQLADLDFQAVLQHHQHLYFLVLAKQLQKTLWTYGIIRHSASVVHFQARNLNFVPKVPFRGKKRLVNFS